MSDQVIAADPQDVFPHDRAVEEACLGAAIVDPGKLDEANLEPEDFYVITHQDIWRALLTLHSKGLPIDFATLGDQLDQMGKLGEIGGLAKLTVLLNAAWSCENFQAYASIVRRYSWKRRCLMEINRIAKGIFDKGADEEKFGDTVLEATDRMLSGRAKSGTVHVRQVLTQVYDQVMEKIKDPTDVWGMRTGLIDLDNLLGGLQAGEIFEIGGKPGVGKSKTALAMGMGLAKNGYGGGIYSMEMLNIANGYRILSSTAQVYTRKMHSGYVEDDEITRLTNAYDIASNLPIYMNDNEQTISSLRADLIMLQRRYGIKWFILDYLMLLGGYEKMDENPRIAALSRGIKAIVQKTGLSAIVLNSVTKAGMDGDPSMADMRGPGQVIHDADLVAFVTVPQEVYSQNIIRLRFEKTRDVSSGVGKVIELLACNGYPAITNVTTRHVDLVEF